MQYIPNFLFIIALIFGIGYFIKNSRKVIRNIKLGHKVDSSDHKKERWGNVIRIALGQSKMVVRPVAGLIHIIVYAGFIIINIEVLEIIIDGIFGTHRIFAGAGAIYDYLIASFEILALLVFVGVIIFWIRRNIQKIKRFLLTELRGSP